MRLVFLGTGCPVATPERLGPAHLIDHDGTRVLVDCGSGVAQRLVAAGVPGRDVDALLVTHLHTDHVIDFYQLVMASWHQGREWPWRVFGPTGTRAFVEQTFALWEPERSQRIAHEKRPSTVGLEVEVEEIADGWTGDFAGLAAAAFEVDHRPVRHALGFAFEGGGKRLVHSGDTRPCAALERAAKGADVLVNEVFVHREMPVVPGVRSAETVENVASYHTLSTDVGTMAARAGVKCLALTHFVPPGCDRDALIAEVAADFTGPIVIGEDLMVLDLETRTVRHGTTAVALGIN